jgi:hypothetical protein
MTLTLAASQTEEVVAMRNKELIERGHSRQPITVKARTIAPPQTM